jgi:hypothetical protein
VRHEGIGGWRNRRDWASIDFRAGRFAPRKLEWLSKTKAALGAHPS